MHIVKVGRLLKAYIYTAQLMELRYAASMHKKVTLLRLNIKYNKLLFSRRVNKCCFAYHI